MKKFAFSSKMHLFIIISSLLVVIGLAVGLICQFAADGFFNWGGDYSSYQCVEVRLYNYDVSTDEAEEICDDAFDNAGVSYYSKLYSEDTSFTRIEYRFTSSQDSNAIQSAVEEINQGIKSSGEPALNGSYHYESLVAEIGGEETLMWAGIALAAGVAFQFLYFLIRYKLMMACAAFIADIHNLALFLALLAITRVQVSSSIVSLSIFVVVLTMICCAFVFDKMRRNFRTDEYKAMSSFEQSDAATRECFPVVTTINVALAAIIAVFLIFVTFGAMSVYSLFMTCIAAIFAVLAVEYGTLFFIPSVYSRLKLKADIRAKEKDKKIRSGRTKKSKKSATADVPSAE